MSKTPSKNPNVTTIYVGRKNVMDYVYYAQKNNTAIVKIIARGKLISKAVSVAEVLKRKGSHCKVSIKIGSFEATNKFSRKVFVSTIEITLKF